MVLALLAFACTSGPGGRRPPGGSSPPAPPGTPTRPFPESPAFDPAAAVRSPTPDEAALLRGAVALGALGTTRWEVSTAPLGFLADGRALRRLVGEPGLLAVDPAGAFEAVLLPAAPATPWIAVSPDRAAALVVSAPAATPGSVAVHRIGPADLGPTWSPPSASSIATLPLPTDPTTFALRSPEAASVREALVALDSGRLCLSDRFEVHCWLPGAPDWTHPLDLAALAELAPSPQAEASIAAILGRPPDGWVAEIAAMTAIPGDRVGVLLSVSPVSGGTVQRLVADVWVLAVDEGGVDALARETTYPARPAIGLEWGGAAHHPLLGCEALVWVDAVGALGALCRGQDHTWEDPWNAPGEALALALPAYAPQRWTGFALALLALDGGRGALPLTDAWLRSAVCDQAGSTYQGCAYGGLPRPWREADGTLSLVAVQEPAEDDPFYRLDRLAVSIDLDRADLDGDQLSGAAEDAAGTHPLRGDSDGGGDDDGDEVRGGTDPTDPADDPAQHAPPALRWREEPGWGAALGLDPVGGSRDWDTVVGGTTAEGPLCGAGRCVGAEGGVLATWEEPPDRSDGFLPQKTLDGDWLALPTAGETAVRLVHTETGEVRDVLPIADLDALLPRTDPLGQPAAGWQGLTAWVAAPNEIWVLQWTAPARVAVFDAAGHGRVAYDGETWRCAAGFGPCDPGPFPAGPNLTAWNGGVLPGEFDDPPDLPPPMVDDLNPGLAFVWGYEPDAERLLVLVFTTWGTHMLALHAERPAERWGGLPDVTVTTVGDGDPLLYRSEPILERTRWVLGPGERLDGVGRSTPQGRPLPGGAVAELPQVGAFGDRFGIWRFGPDGRSVVLAELRRGP